MKIKPTHRQSPGPARRFAAARRAAGPFPSASVIAAGTLAALLLAGCSAGSSDTASSVPAGASSGGSVSGEVAARDSAQFAPGAKSGAAVPGAPADVTKGGSAAVSVAVGPKLTKSASLDLRVKEVSAAAARVRSIAAGVQAMVVSEQIGRGGPGDPKPLANDGRTSNNSSDIGDLTGFGTMTLSVPSDKLDAALDQLSKIGTVLQRNTSSQDVTAQYVDTESRLKTMRSSVERVRMLMAQAKDIGQVVALESEMSRREADLESLESQLAALKNNVERSTVAVSLSTPASSVEPASDNAFLAGLRSGWDAFATSAAGLLKGIGAVLPFALFFALIGSPLLWWTRRRIANRPAATSTPSGPAPTVAPAGPASA